MVIVSACLLGVHCRYDGEAVVPEGTECCLAGKLLAQLCEEGIVPVCPEQWGGLPTPRSPALIVGGDIVLDADGYDVLAGRARVINTDGDDVTENYLRGARDVVDMAKWLGVRKAYLKSKSPSCGVGGLSDGDDGVRPGDGVAAALLMQNGIEVVCVG